MDGTGSAVGSAIAPILMILILVGVFYVVRTLLIFLMKKNQKVLSLILIICTMPIMFIGIFAYISASSYFSKERGQLYNEVAAMPSDAMVDELIKFINKRGCVNDPRSWNQLRAVWFAVNESPRVTTAKKNELKSFLMLRGLNMHHNDAKVKNNYRK